MRTIGHKHQGVGRGDFAARCSYCGTYWLRSSLRRDAAGLLYCPQEGTGLDSVALSEAISEAAADYLGPGNNPEGGTPMVHSTAVAIDIDTLFHGSFKP